MTHNSGGTNPSSRLTPEELRVLWMTFVESRDAATPNLKARDRLIEHYLPLVTATAEQMHGQFAESLDVEDLTLCGNRGLIDAIESYEPEEGTKFTAYCNARIMGAILDEIRLLE